MAQKSFKQPAVASVVAEQQIVPNQQAPAPQLEQMVKAHSPGPGDAEFYLGKKGIVHQLGGGVVRVFLGQEAGGQVADLFGNLEDMGLKALADSRK